MELSRDRRGEVEVLTLSGSIHADDNDAFGAALSGLKEEQRFRLVIDASGLEYINSRAISDAVKFVQNARLQDGRVVFVHPGPTAEKIMRAVGLMQLVRTFETLDDAVAACEG